MQKRTVYLLMGAIFIVLIAGGIWRSNQSASGMPIAASMSDGLASATTTDDVPQLGAAIPQLGAALPDQRSNVYGRFWLSNVLSRNSTLGLDSTETYADTITAPVSEFESSLAQWELVEIGGYFHITNVGNGGHLRPRTDDDFSRLYVVPSGSNSSGHWTQWSFEPVKWGGFRIINRQTGKYLRPGNFNAENLPYARSAPAKYEGAGTAWNLVSTLRTAPIGNTAYAGGGGFVAGALPHSCESQEGFTVVDSLTAMKAAMGQSNVKVRLAKGEYSVTIKDANLYADIDGRFDLLPVTGNNSVYDFRCTHISFDTALRRQLGAKNTTHLSTWGNNNLIRHFTIEDIGDAAPQGRALQIRMDGRNNVLEGAIITSRGSSPYGLGDAYGRGTEPILSHQKHAGVLIRGLRNTFRQSTVFNHAYGHAVFMQGSQDTLIDGVYIQGNMRSTNDMLAARNPRFALADALASGVDFMTVFGYRLPPEYYMSLQEDGIRAFNGGKTVMDGVTTGPRPARNVRVLNSVIRNHRAGVNLVYAHGEKFVNNTTTLSNESGFSIGSGDIVSSYSDARYGPVIAGQNRINAITADITIVPSDDSKNNTGIIAFINGSNHEITLRSKAQSINDNLKVLVGGHQQSVRDDLDSQTDPGIQGVDSTRIINLTKYPMVIHDTATGITGRSIGPVSGNNAGSNLIEVN